MKARPVHKKTALGLEPECGSFCLGYVLVVAGAVMMRSAGIRRMGIGRMRIVQPGVTKAGIVQAGVVTEGSAAFGVLGGFQITNFDVFLCLGHISYPVLG